MKLFLKGLCAAYILMGIISCNKDKEGEPVVNTFTYTFENDPEGWTAGFSDYPADWDKSGLEFRFEHTDLPAEVNENSGSLLVSGRNLSDDLFMFIKKKITGLKPDHPYLLSFEVVLASQYPTESIGIGGSPGSSVFLKAGGSAIEPQPVVENGEVLMNIDKGNQSQSGSNMLVLGNIGIPGEEFNYQLIQRNNLQNPVRVQTDASGNLWLIVGTDSGFEGTTTVYYNNIKINLEE